MPREASSKAKGLRAEVLSRPAPTGMLASAVHYSGAPSGVKQKSKPPKKEAWQTAAWNFFDTIGEYRYSCNWVGNILSKATLFIAKDGKLDKNAKATEALDALFGGAEGHSEMLRQIGIQFTVAGEFYVVSYEDDGEDEWLIAAATEVQKVSADHWKVDGDDLEQPMVIRVWRQHPRNHKLADAPTRAVLPILSEIDGLTKHVSAQIDSRLAGAGILLLPSEITFATSPVVNEDGTTSIAPGTSAAAFVAELVEVMATAIENREDASAIVPIILQAEGEHLANIKHLTFWSELDGKAIELRSEAIRRLALGMDMPPEILTGTAEMNHWGSWQVEEAAIKAHTEPLLSIVTSSLTTGYLRHYLTTIGGMDADEARKYTIEADTSLMRLRPNRSQEAMELHDRGQLSGIALLRENGFSEDDMMDEDELKTWLARKVASGSSTPEQVEAALRYLGVELDVIQAEAMEVDKPNVREARPAPSLEEHPSRAPRAEDIDEGLTAAALANEAANRSITISTAELMIHRALERAGNKLKSKIPVASRPDCKAYELYLHGDQFSDTEITDLLDGAWAPIRIFGYDVQESDLNTYTTMLLQDRRKYDRETLAAYLDARQALREGRA